MTDEQLLAAGWHLHRGGPCPVEEGLLGHVAFRDGYVTQNQGFLAHKSWLHLAADKACDIIAFKLAADQLTPWFDSDTKPVHVGAYNAGAFKKDHERAHWDGGAWSWGWQVGAPQDVIDLCMSHRLPGPLCWRGFSSPQEGA